jgi:hypothetical protein
MNERSDLFRVRGQVGSINQSPMQEQEQQLEEELWRWVRTWELELGWPVEPQEASGGQQGCRRRRRTRTALRRRRPRRPAARTQPLRVECGTALSPSLRTVARSRRRRIWCRAAVVSSKIWVGDKGERKRARPAEEERPVAAQVGLVFRSGWGSRSCCSGCCSATWGPICRGHGARHRTLWRQRAG